MIAAFFITYAIVNYRYVGIMWFIPQQSEKLGERRNCFHFNYSRDAACALAVHTAFNALTTTRVHGLCRLAYRAQLFWQQPRPSPEVRIHRRYLGTKVRSSVFAGTDALTSFGGCRVGSF